MKERTTNLNFSLIRHFIIEIYFILKKSEKKIKINIFLALFFLILTMLFNVISPWILKKIVEQSDQNNIDNVSYLMMYGFLYGFSWLSSQICMQMREILAFKPIERIIRLISIRLFSHIHKLPVSIFNSHHAGEITETFNAFRDSFSFLFVGFFLFLFPTVIEIICIAIILAKTLSSGVTALFICFLGIYFLLTKNMLAKLECLHDKCIEKKSELSDNILETLYNYQMIKVHATLEKETSRFDESLLAVEKNQVKTNTRTEKIRLMQGAFLGFFLIGLIFTTLGYGHYQNNKIALFILVNAYFIQLVTPLNLLSMILNDIKQGMAAYKKICILMAEKEEIIKKSKDIVEVKIQKIKRIKFNAVAFDYTNHRKTLSNINLLVEPQKITCIIGETGSGKSTILKLLLRFFEPVSGQIEVNDLGLDEYDFQNWRRSIGYVPQDLTLFSNSIHYNLTYGADRYTDDDIKNAIQKSALGELLNKLPEGLYAKVSERASNLSGGEKQRILLGRLFLQTKKLYLLDEPTSSLDRNTKKIILNSLVEIKEDAPVVIVSHDSDLLSIADFIYTIKDGQLVHIQKKAIHGRIECLDLN